MLTIFQNFIELLYLYKQSNFYTFHIVLMFLILVLNVIFLIKEKQIQESEAKPPESKCHTKVDYVDYARTVKQNTQKELDKLQQS